MQSHDYSQENQSLPNKIENLGQIWWYTPCILEAEASKSLQVQAQPVLHSEILFVFVCLFVFIVAKEYFNL